MQIMRETRERYKTLVREAFLTDFRTPIHNSLSLRLRKLKDAASHFSGNARFLSARLSRGISNENLVIVITTSAHPQTISPF